MATIVGTVSDDILYGTSGPDTIDGLAGDDILVGGTGNDVFNGGSGLDWSAAGPGDDTLNISQGWDQAIIDLRMTAGGAGLTGFKQVNLTDVSADDLFAYKSGDHLGILNLQNTTDSVAVLDFYGAGVGTNWSVTTTTETLTPTSDSDSNGIADIDEFSEIRIGSADSDNLSHFGTRVNIIWGGLGNDVLSSGSAGTILFGGGGNDTLNAQTSATVTDNVLVGGNGDDTYVVTNGSTAIIFDNGSGFDTLSMTSVNLGGFNTDAFTIANRHLFVGDLANGTAVIIWDWQTDQDGLDQVILSNGTFTRALIESALSGISNFSWADLGISETEVNEAFAFYQILSGGDEGPTMDMVSGGTVGNDSLFGGTGNDVLTGGLGVDSMTGGSGDDAYVVGNVSDSISEAVSGGTDTVFSSVSYTLPANVENLTLTGTTIDADGLYDTDINATGNSLNNRLIGNAGDNVLDGGGGNDTLYGGNGDDWFMAGLSDGDDVLTGGPGFDTLDFSGVGGVIQVNQVAGTVTGSAGNDTLLDVFERVIGSEFDDVLSGGHGISSLIGGGGNDQFFANRGDDLVRGGAGNDSIVSSLSDGDDRYEGGAGFDTLDFSGVSGVIQVNQVAGTVTGSAGNDTLLDVFERVIGSEFDDVLSGGHGISSLMGGGGDDQFFGNRGDDLMRGGEGNDRFYFSLSDGDDRLEGSNGFDILDYSGLGGVVQVNQLAGTTTGSAGNDTLLDVFEQIIGTDFGDVLSGGHGINSLNGGGGDDQIFANNGDDYVTGGTGTDTITLGIGNDVFQFFDGDGHDTLTDFTAGASSDDVINLTTESSASSLTQMQNDGMISQVGADTVIDFGGGDMITLVGVTDTDLSIDDFVF